MEDQERYVPDANLTLDEIGVKDEGMLEDVIKGAKRYSFASERLAEGFRDYARFCGFQYVGLTIHPGMDYRMIDRILDSKKIRIEERPYPFKTGDESWKNGMYIYKEDQLAVFISDVRPIVDRRAPLVRPVNEVGTMQAALVKAGLANMEIEGGMKMAPSSVNIIKPAGKFAVITNSPVD